MSPTLYTKDFSTSTCGYGKTDYINIAWDGYTPVGGGLIYSCVQGIDTNNGAVAITCSLSGNTFTVSGGDPGIHNSYKVRIYYLKQ